MWHYTGQYRWILDRGVPRHARMERWKDMSALIFDIHDQKAAAEKVRIADDMTRLMNAQDQERRRIARELHDSAGQTLAVLGMNLARLLHRAEGIAPELVREGKEIEAMVQQIHREIRHHVLPVTSPVTGRKRSRLRAELVRRGIGRTQ